jgi:hypothetical protein
MKFETHEKNVLFLRALLVMVMIALAATLRFVTHPWNFTPVGAMALFGGAMFRDRRLAFVFPLLALFAGDCFIGFYKIMPVVYASFLVNVAIGLWLENRQTPGKIGGAVLLGAIQFFVVTNFAVWAFGHYYPLTFAGLVSCFSLGIPYFWNTLAGDAVYAALLFGGFALAEKFVPFLREPAVQSAR